MMTGSQYHTCMEWTREHIGVKRARCLVKILTVLCAAGYAGSLLALLLQAAGIGVHPVFGLHLGRSGDYAPFWRMLLIPAVSFLAVSLFRSLLSAPRPYEVYDFVPLLDKDTKGKSFPSRHVFSNFVIAMAVLSVSAAGGVFLMVCGACLAVLRVATGVHFPKDVVAGAVLAVLIGYMGFFFF